MNSEIRTCQNCKADFAIESEDFDFYKKIKVPPPTWCPECRMVRRLTFRNDRSLYRRKCDLCRKDMVAMYPPDTKFPVYCRECWYSDAWDPLSYGREVDFSRNFFDQLKDLYDAVPRLALFQINPVNSPFANGMLDSKNVYLAYSIVKSEDIMYSKSIDRSSTVLDSVESVNLEQCYENINSEKNFNSHFVMYAWNCIDSWFLYDCANCKHCILSSNLRNKEYVIRNKQYSKDEYFEELKKFDFGSAKALQDYKAEYAGVRKNALHKFGNILKSVNVTGHNMANAKNAKRCFELYNVENVKYCYRVLDLKDCQDVTYAGWGELYYEHSNGGNRSSNMHFSVWMLENIRDSEYMWTCNSAANLFGCASVKKKEYCILNKQYTPEEYQDLRTKIIAHMNANPHVDPQGRTWRYGEFFPLHFAEPFGYNETVAQELFPLTKEAALKRGYAWKDMDAKGHTATKAPEDLPDSIKDVGDDILQEIIGCAHKGECNEQCTVAFRVIPDELQFYRQKGLPLPRLCPNCRHYERLQRMEPLRLWKRPCQCAGANSENLGWKNGSPHFHGSSHCPNEFQTPYAPDRPEAVYCEQCYQAEVM
ncbi:MAG: hypothetical protein A2855_02685 [Candidatus Liptonbacteria bacterium RIFCSPHIGHO2_01_FULL_57_28]|uniref:Zinc-binding domain-containing protein n=1 Tax=Candidatus Liptonbacteria bacterium RIFCSPHIGHO2_01_FULL_57_28 TaxID=1798647 RepID=A0A1G2CB65_9BACT|nr:MAG: hypothetical protein A2855_02685 [Candidatus Liptonbacteria bacterium RIFCSPHIGHO2_01_FULL_57_28]